MSPSSGSAELGVAFVVFGSALCLATLLFSSQGSPIPFPSAGKERSMRRLRTITALALSTLLLVSVISAQQTAATAQPTATSAQPTSTTTVPNLIRYSGTLKDAQGAALSSNVVGVTFAIYKQQDGGAAVWQETQNVTPDANGQYSVILGSTTATGLPDDLFSQQEQRWLGVQVQGQDEQARVLLVSVPYAFKAHEAETLGGLPASAFIKAPLSGLTGSTSTERHRCEPSRHRRERRRRLERKRPRRQTSARALQPYSWLHYLLGQHRCALCYGALLGQR